MESRPNVARARTDGKDRLLRADEPLAGLQRRCGGEIPGTIASQALLELVRKARTFNLRMARPVKILGDAEWVSAWAEVEPDPEGDGCVILLSNWQVNSLPPEDLGEVEQRRTDIDRQLAELVARLDPQQALLAVDSDSPDLAGVLAEMRSGIGRPWTDFVEIEGNNHRQPLHWRLLDGARIRIPGSSRRWSASLAPQGGPVPGSAGFELYLVADEPPSEPLRPFNVTHRRSLLHSAAIGREIAPVLRQPISRIIANAETIRSQLAGPLAAEYSNYAADIAAAGEHLLSLIDDLSDLEVVEADDFTAALDEIDLVDVTRRAIGILQVRAQERRIRIQPPQETDRAPAIGEFRRVLQILLNLINNAIRYSPEGSEVFVRIDKGGGRSRVTVADQGHGLAPDQQEKIFDKFERLGRKNDGGSGLGLYISRRLARAMQGNLTVESAQGEGARFTLELPSGM